MDRGHSAEEGGQRRRYVGVAGRGVIVDVRGGGGDKQEECFHPAALSRSLSCPSLPISRLGREPFTRLQFFFSSSQTMKDIHMPYDDLR